ncbi:MAG: tetratricopeptide repeat protein [Lautropia sp.]|nr:tetratricopeptide repeat protein [Lautropia sp.]
MMYRTGLAFLGAAFMALSYGCALEPGRNHTEKTVRVCSPEGGCTDKTRDEIRAQRIGDAPTQQELQEDARISSLEEKAADDPRAAFDLALRFFRGDGVRRDSRKAVVWMKKAAEGGSTQAQVALGRLYLSGFEEMGPDPAAAESWLSVAAARGDEEAKKLLTEAQRAKRNEVAWRSWVGAYRSTWLGHWWHGYGYYLYWGGRGWHYY